MKAEKFRMCPDCHADISNIFPKFVDPSDPVVNCPGCGESFYKAPKRFSLRLYFNL